MGFWPFSSILTQQSGSEDTLPDWAAGERNGGMLTGHGAVLGAEIFGGWAGSGGQLGPRKCMRRRKGHLALYFANTSLG